MKKLTTQRKKKTMNLLAPKRSNKIVIKSASRKKAEKRFRKKLVFVGVFVLIGSFIIYQASASTIRIDFKFNQDFATTIHYEREQDSVTAPRNTPICYISGFNQAPLQPIGWDMSPFTGFKINATPLSNYQKGLNPYYYGSTGCQNYGNKMGFYLNSAVDAAGNVANYGIRTIQMRYLFSRTTKEIAPTDTVFRPWSSAKYGMSSKLRLDTYMKRNGNSNGNGTIADQQIFMYVSLSDTSTEQPIWFAINLWDSKGDIINTYPPVISDMLAGGGTRAFNVLGNLNDNVPQTKLVTRHPQSQNTSGTPVKNSIPNWYSGSISRDQMKYVAESINALIASDPIYSNARPYSTNPEDYIVTSFSIDAESVPKLNPPQQDWLGFTSWSSKVMVEY
jgi:hypothetical protein